MGPRDELLAEAEALSPEDKRMDEEKHCAGARRRQVLDRVRVHAASWRARLTAT
jgi:hypothetical protein